MNVSFTCECGQEYQAPAHYAGRLAKCRSCKRSLRIPRPPAPAARPDEVLIPTRDEILDDEPFEFADIAADDYGQALIPRRIQAPAAESSGGDDSGPRWEALVEGLPRWDDLKLAGVGILGTALMALTGRKFGLALVAWLVLLGILAPIFLIWAAIAAVKAASKQKAGAAPLLMVSGIIALSFLEAILLLFPQPIRLITALLGVIILAANACLLLWASKAKAYREPLARGFLGFVLFGTFAGLIGVVRQNLETLGIGDLQPAAELASTADGGQPAIKSLLEARRGFQTRLVPRPTGPPEPLASPPPNLFRVVQYPSPAGQMSAYLTPDPGDGTRRPAIVWITGGDCNTIGEVWGPQDPQDDQAATGYRENGMVLMFPSLRGGNTNPGRREGFFGEVDDVLAAAEFLATQPYVDPERIYLGGHSTGGTLVMLVAESAGPSRFRAVFSFGPVHNPIGYGPDSEYLPYDTSNARENELRSPIKWLPLIRCPTYVIEGSSQPSNGMVIGLMKSASKNANVHFLMVPRATHFSILGPANRTIAAKIMAEARGEQPFAIREGELDTQFGH